MTVAVWFLLMALAVAAVMFGRVDIALWIAGCKTLLVGLQFMELRHAARLHATVFVVWTGLLTTALVLFSR